MATIIGLQGCPRCSDLKLRYPGATYIELPNISLGLGDTISKLTRMFSVRPCHACRIRQHKFNKWIPYTWRINKLDRDIAIMKRNICLLDMKEYPILIPTAVEKETLKLLLET